MAKETELDDRTFQDAIENADKPILVDFWAPWCAPCLMVSPTVMKVGEKYADKIDVAKVNVDDAGATATALGIRSIPTLMIFSGGEIKERVVGVQDESTLSRLVDKVLAG